MYNYNNLYRESYVFVLYKNFHYMNATSGWGEHHRKSFQNSDHDYISHGSLLFRTICLLSFFKKICT